MTASYQFRLRAIVLVVTALLSVLALGFRARVVRREAVIAQRIEDLGGYAFFDEEADAKPRSSVFPRLRAVAFYARSNVSDDDLSMLREIPKLKEVHLSNVSVSDRGLNLIGEIQSLAGLVLTSVPITDAGVSNLHSLHNLAGFTWRIPS